MTEVIKHEYSSNILSAEEIDEAPEEFGTFSTYEEFQTRASRRKDVGMDDPLSAKLGEFDLNDPANENEELQEHERYMYIPAVTKDTLECEWQTLFGCENFKKGLKNLAYDGRLRDCTRFRGVCWRIFLECLPEDSNCWLDAVSESRKTYKNLKSKLLVDPYSNVLSKENVQVFNPLSQESDSPWTQYFEDKKLHEVIHQDLDRLFPGMHYFQSKKIKDILLHILFCYARTNPNVGYKQGMHEILAPIVFVLEYDSEVYEFLDSSDNKLMKNLINPEFLESDAFCLFERLMDVIEPWYARGDLPSIPSKQTFDPSIVPFMEEQPLLPPTAVVRKLNRIQENMLKKYDTVLYNHLRDMNIEPQLYGLRWVRLLYGREFTTMEDILTLWDGIFADGLSLDLVDYVYLSLVCSKRRKSFQ
ncbi:TBC1 domain family member 5-like isoform X2 [Xenia sp. Carnegie-2017]|uniref:TBC1 domain family member 5-like isoform X2 n=1 Tax=Xenia sp. Carnegie-2017 TaxID=2897299 RepID=UPI001F03C29B|nr:TBC1 domain family member 5-like isoform X2 [Xenia sp. Carnegie-2017]